MMEGVFVCIERRSRYVMLPSWYWNILDDNKLKIHLKSKFALFQTSSILFNFI